MFSRLFNWLDSREISDVRFSVNTVTDRNHYVHVRFRFIVLAHLLRFSCGPAETADGTCSLHGYRYQVGGVLLHTALRGAMVQYRDMLRDRGGSQSVAFVFKRWLLSNSRRPSKKIGISHFPRNNVRFQFLTRSQFNETVNVR